MRRAHNAENLADPREYWYQKYKDIIGLSDVARKFCPVVIRVWRSVNCCPSLDPNRLASSGGDRVGTVDHGARQTGTQLVRRVQATRAEQPGLAVQRRRWRDTEL
jgi:hypothetical protein